MTADVAGNGVIIATWPLLLERSVCMWLCYHVPLRWNAFLKMVPCHTILFSSRAPVRLEWWKISVICIARSSDLWQVACYPVWWYVCRSSPEFSPSESFPTYRDIRTGSPRLTLCRTTFFVFTLTNISVQRFDERCRESNLSFWQLVGSSTATLGGSVVCLPLRAQCALLVRCTYLLCPCIMTSRRTYCPSAGLPRHCKTLTEVYQRCVG
jgi:hypothetical protein